MESLRYGVIWKNFLERVLWPLSFLTGSPTDQWADVGTDRTCPITQSDSDCGLRWSLPSGLLVYSSQQWVQHGKVWGNLPKRHPISCPNQVSLGNFMEGMTKLSRLALGGWWWGLGIGACWPAAWRGNGASSGPVPVCLWCVLLAFGERQLYTIKAPWKPLRYLSKTHNGLHWKPGFDWCEVWDSTQVRIHAARSPEKPDDLE